MEDRCQTLLDQLPAGHTADAYAIQRHTSKVRFSADRLESVRHTSTCGSGLRVVVNDRLGCAGGTDHVPSAQVTADAIELAKFGPRVDELELPGPPTHDITEDRYFADTEALATEHLMDQCRDVVDRILTVRDDVKVDVTASRSGGGSMLANTSGLSHHSQSTVYSLSVTVKRSNSGEILSCSAGASVRDHRNERAGAAPLCKQVLDQLSRCDRSAEIETGNYPVIFSRSGVYGLLYPVLLGLDGENLSKGTSPLATERASRKFSNSFHMSSDPTIESAIATRALDGEGAIAQPINLVVDGCVQSGLFDQVTMAKWRMQFPDQAGWARPGSARRGGFGGNTSPGYATLVLAPGNESDLLRDVGRGVLVEQMLGVSMGNPISGEFSNNVYIGHLIEDGQIVGRVKNLMIAGNSYDALNSIEAIGDTQEWVGDRMFLPPLRVAGLQVTSKS
jgi:PmbA protein